MLRVRRSASTNLKLCLLVKLGVKASRPARHHKAEGNVLPLVLFTTLVVTVGAVALMTRSSNSWLSSVSNSDYQAAKEAAETGFNRILADLNTNQKSHFLVTRFSNWYANSPSTTEASNCNVFMPGVASAPSNAKTELAFGTGQFYQLTSYVAPERSPGSPDGQVRQSFWWFSRCSGHRICRERRFYQIKISTQENCLCKRPFYRIKQAITLTTVGHRRGGEHLGQV